MAKREAAADALCSRHEEVWALHVQGLSVRAIGAQLGLSSTQVHRVVDQMKAKLRAQRSEQYLLDLSDFLTAGALADLADSHRVSAGLEAAGELTALAQERSARLRLRQDIARFNGCDPVKQAELAIKERLAEAQLKEKELEPRLAALEEKVARQAAGDDGRFDRFFEEEPTP